ncbi:MAG: phenylalanine--tRNA ligase subunit beta, partial [Gemmatimonadota bacterium]
IAREVAAAQNLTMRLHALPRATGLAQLELNGDGSARGRAPGVDVSIEDERLCPRYCGLVVRDVTVGPSPEWLATRLRAVGLRPISNVVDATNYVLHELGQPLHAFDLDTLGGRVVVRRARAGERITTLDAVERELTEGMLVIADAERPIAIAGVMGGADSEVQPRTRNILLECALFDAASIRATRRALGLSTDASYRFERGVDPDGMLQALRRAAELIVLVAGGSVETTVAAPGRGLPAPAAIELRLRRIEQVLGTAFDAPQVVRYLEPLGFGVARPASDVLRVEVPGHRRYDVAREEDLIEEIARRHGYDAFADDLRPFRLSAVPDHPLFTLENRLRTLLAGRGLLEAHTAAFAPAAEGSVELLLPLAVTESRLRSALLPGLLRRVEYNFARGARSIRLFEIGTVFETADGGLPRESTRLAIAVTGRRRPPHWSEPDAPVDFWDLKSLAHDVARVLGLEVDVDPVSVEPDRHGTGSGQPLLGPGLSLRLAQPQNGGVAGVAGLVQPDRLDAPAWAGDVWGLEVVVEPLGSRAAAPLRFEPLAQHPAVERDLALLVPRALPAVRVVGVVRDNGGALLEWVTPFDVYSGRGVPDDMRSIAFRLRFRAADRTLLDAEVDTVVRRILQRLSDDLGVQQRD